MSAKIIIFEGVSGCGKTTQSLLLQKELQRKYTVFLTREPGGAMISEAIRGVLRNFATKDPMSRFLLLMAARLENWKVIENRMEEYDFIIIDRFNLSTFIYQVCIDEIDFSIYEKLIPHVDYLITFILDVPAPIAIRSEINVIGDSYSSKFEKIRSLFLQAGEREKNVVIDGTGSVLDVGTRILGELEKVVK